MRRRSRLWWYRRFRRAYRKHGVTIKTRRETFSDACFSRRVMAPGEQRTLRPIGKP